jgi:hypothetical protein
MLIYSLKLSIFIQHLKDIFFSKKEDLLISIYTYISYFFTQINSSTNSVLNHFLKFSFWSELVALKLSVASNVGKGQKIR